MSIYDIQRIENAIWILEAYRDKLDDYDPQLYIDGVKFTTNDALRVLDLALYLIKMEQKESKYKEQEK